MPVIYQKNKIHVFYEISTLDILKKDLSEVKFIAAKSINEFNEVGLEPFDKIENIKIKHFDACIAILKSKLINEIKEYNLEINFDAEILKFRQLLLDHDDFEESTQRATAALKALVKKAVKLRETANLAHSIYDELVAEGKRLEQDYAQFDIDLRPGLRMARKKAVVQGLSLKMGKVMLRDVAKRIIEKEVQVRDREILLRKIDADLFDEGLRIEKEFEEFSVDLRKNLKIVRKKAIFKGLSFEEGKSLMRESAKVFLDDKFRSQQKEEKIRKIKEISNFIDDICLTSEEFNGKGRALLEGVLEDVINNNHEIDVLAIKGNLLNIAKVYLEKVAEAWGLQKSNKKFEDRALKSDLVIFYRNEMRFDKNKRQISRGSFNSVLADKLRLALDNSGNK